MEVEKTVFAESVIGSGANIESQEKSVTTSQAEISTHQPGEYKVIRRNNKVTNFDAGKISVALTKAFLDVEGGTDLAVSVCGRRLGRARYVELNISRVMLSPGLC